jgi:hypothetical protein
MNLVIRPFSPDDSDAWDQLVTESWNGTFLHSRRFLRYHGERFQDVSLLIEDSERKILVGLFPAAIDRTDPARVVSHPGITYGGIVHQGGLLGSRMLAALEAICEYYASGSFRTLRYKVVPNIYHRRPTADDLYALFRLKANRYRCDLSSTIDLTNRPKPAHGRMEQARKAQRRGVRVEVGPQFLRPFWAILQANLEDRHEAAPVHSLAEIEYLHSCFPENIICVAAIAGGEVVAGDVTFRTDKVDHGQYCSSSPEGRRLYSVPLVVEHCIAMAAADGLRYFDMGISNEEDGLVLNEGLHKFKSEFGGSGVAHEFYEIDLVQKNWR